MHVLAVQHLADTLLIAIMLRRVALEEPRQTVGRPARQAILVPLKGSGESRTFFALVAATEVNRLVVKIPPADANAIRTKHLTRDLDTPLHPLDRNELLVIDIGADDQHLHAERVEQFKACPGQTVASGPKPIRLDFFEWCQPLVSSRPDDRNQLHPVSKRLATRQ